eukprot:s4194_g2.t2
MKGDKGHGKGWHSGWKGSKQGSKQGKGKGKVSRLNLPTAKAPEIIAGTSYCYAAKHSYIDVLTPAWHCRPLVPQLPKVDLRFEALRELQMSSGGFEVSPLLLGRLGATEQEPVLNLAKDLKGRDLEVLGARLVLKAAEFYNERPNDDIEKLLDITFGIVRGLWSFFELWERLLPSEILHPFKDSPAVGGILCTRFFLVDLAAAPWSPYEIDKSYPLFRSGKHIYMGQVPRSGVEDRMRQGHELEAAWVKNSEEKILMSLQLPNGRQVLFAAAPDALDPSLAECLAPLETETNFVGAGYEEAESFPYPTEPKTCRIWRKSARNSGLDAPLGAYIEIKKTTHLNGLNGAYKLLNYWLQASLMKAGAVCVAFADDATGVVSHGQKFSLRQLEAEIQERFQDPDILPKVWASLLHSLELISGTMQGRSQLHLFKHRGFGERLREELTEGWGEMTETMEAVPFEPRARQL